MKQRYYGYTFVSLDRQSIKEEVLANFADNIAGKQSAIAYAEGFIEAMVRYSDIDLHIRKNEDFGYIYWSEYNEHRKIVKTYMVVDKYGDTVKG